MLQTADPTYSTPHERSYHVFACWYVLQACSDWLLQKANRGKATWSNSQTICPIYHDRRAFPRPHLYVRPQAYSQLFPQIKYEAEMIGDLHPGLTRQ